MRKGILLLLAIMSLATINANNTNKLTSKIGVTNRYNDAVTFIEKNVQFHVFLNGDFKYNSHYRNTKYNIQIERDYRGRVKRIGNTLINYDYSGNVKQIGRVSIDYRFGKLTKVGHLKIEYDRWGTPKFFGNVKYNDYYNEALYYNNTTVINNSNNTCNYNDVYFYKKDFRNKYRQYKEDSNFFYYRAIPNAKLGKYGKILKRRKNKNYIKKYHLKRTTKQRGKYRRSR